MARRQKKLSERFTQEYKRSKTEYINTIFSRLIYTKHNGKIFTVHMITNWIYGRNENHTLDDVFEELMQQLDPSGLKEDKLKVQEKVNQSILEATEA